MPESPPAVETKPLNPRLLLVPMERIRPPEIAARATMSDSKMDDLIESLKQIGLTNPITLESRGDDYEIIAGHRRFLAATELHWSEIRAIVWDAGSVNVMASRLHENIIREDLNAAEEALFMAEVREKLNLDEFGLIDTFKRSRHYIADRFELLRGDPVVFEAVRAGEIRLGVAHELNRISDEVMRRYYLDVARRTDPPKRVVQQWVESWRANSGPNGGDLARIAAEARGDLVSFPGGQPAFAPGEGPPVGAPPADPRDFGCELCGGWRDPYNLIYVRIHKYEWEHIMQSINAASKGNE
jgi:ParB/RepB/Spo0J family partition protein